MPKAIVVIGLGFGDEGKGSCVDYLVRQFPDPHSVLNVKFNGGCQCGHNVVLPTGEHHTFTQFGSGTLYGCRTYLDRNFIVDPLAILPECKHLSEICKYNVGEIASLLTINSSCLIVTPYHRLLNRIKEINRGVHRHSSCGVGIGECRHYWLKYGQDAIFARDLIDTNFTIILNKLNLLKQRVKLELFELGITELPLYLNQVLTVPTNVIALRMRDDILNLSIRVHDYPPLFSNAILEGSQGVLLDEIYGVHPYITWSDCTLTHANEFIEENNIHNVFKLGITRCFATRHGNGQLPTEGDCVPQNLSNDHNKTNDWQGPFRYGPFDLSLLNKSIHILQKDIDGIALTWLDKFNGRISTHYDSQNKPVIENCGIEYLKSKLDLPVALESHGPTFQDKQIVSSRLQEFLK